MVVHCNLKSEKKGSFVTGNTKNDEKTQSQKKKKKEMIARISFYVSIVLKVKREKVCVCVRERTKGTKIKMMTSVAC